MTNFYIENVTCECKIRLEKNEKKIILFSVGPNVMSRPQKYHSGYGYYIIIAEILMEKELVPANPKGASGEKF